MPNRLIVGQYTKIKAIRQVELAGRAENKKKLIGDYNL